MNRIIAEVYSAPRITAAAKLLPHLGILPDFALDLTTNGDDGEPWDFTLEAHRAKARKLVNEVEPYMLVGSPSCAPYCTWQAINNYHKSPTEIRRARAAADVHLNFVAELYKMQLDAGRYFLHEHPAYAASWSVTSIEDLLKENKVDTVIGDQCQYNLRTQDGDPLKKPTRFMSNAPEVLKKLEKRCKGRHGSCSAAATLKAHGTTSGRDARRAAQYNSDCARQFSQGHGIS